MLSRHLELDRCSISAVFFSLLLKIYEVWTSWHQMSSGSSLWGIGKWRWLHSLEAYYQFSHFLTELWLFLWIDLCLWFIWIWRRSFRFFSVLFYQFCLHTLQGQACFFVFISKVLCFLFPFCFSRFFCGRSTQNSSWSPPIFPTNSWFCSSVDRRPG